MFISEIIIPERRQRHKVENIAELADSISRLGLIHPIVVTRENVLVAGFRRLTACRSLGWTSIPFSYTDELDPLQLHLIELEENIERSDLTWQERHDAIIEYHRLRSVDPEWNQSKTGEARRLSQPTISKHETIEKKKDHPLVRSATGAEQAYRIAARLLEREDQDRIEGVTSLFVTNTYTPILHGYFNTWASAYDGPKFNLIHCDFPYGIDSDKSAQHPSTYADGPDVYWKLLQTLTFHLDAFCADSAHMIFWFSPTHYCQTWLMLNQLDGFKFDETPLIWMKSDQRGIAPDPQRRPRRMYEMAFLGWRNDRKLIRMKNNIVAAPTEREEHPHEKSQAALEYFFEMLVDRNTRLLDPTCGSGSALRAADALGARDVFGIESDAEFARFATRNFEKARIDRNRTAAVQVSGELSSVS